MWLLSWDAVALAILTAVGLRLRLTTRAGGLARGRARRIPFFSVLAGRWLLIGDGEVVVVVPGLVRDGEGVAVDVDQGVSEQLGVGGQLAEQL